MDTGVKVNHTLANHFAKKPKTIDMSDADSEPSDSEPSDSEPSDAEPAESSDLHLSSDED